jgi:hypothetical protein
VPPGTNCVYRGYSGRSGRNDLNRVVRRSVDVAWCCGSNPRILGSLSQVLLLSLWVPPGTNCVHRVCQVQTIRLFFAEAIQSNRWWMGPVDASRSCGCNVHIFMASRCLLLELCILLLYTKSTINLDSEDTMDTLNAPRPCGGSNTGLLFQTSPTYTESIAQMSFFIHRFHLLSSRVSPFLYTRYPHYFALVEWSLANVTAFSIIIHNKCIYCIKTL